MNLVNNFASNISENLKLSQFILFYVLYNITEVRIFKDSLYIWLGLYIC